MDTLFPYLERYLIISGDKYYQTQDLKDPAILEMLYEHITEEAFDSVQYLFDDIFVFYITLLNRRLGNETVKPVPVFGNGHTVIV